MQIQLSEIESVEKLEDFNDEYVYDIEVDGLHNFFGNDILLHNSIYVEFGRIVNQMDITDISEATRFVVDLWNYGCGPYMEEKYEEYAKKFNCDKNLQSLELEKIADTALMVAKKHYAMSECFLEPDIYVTPGEHVLYKGLELIQGSCPPYARECQDDFLKYILAWYSTHNYAPSFDDVYNKIKKYKEDFIKQKPDNICKAQSIGDYEKFILDDKNNITVGLHCPIHVKAAGIANYILNRPENKEYKMKYNKIKTRDKVRFYKTTNPMFPVFAFQPNKFPLEYALPIDYNEQFEDLILGPINKIMEIIGYQKLPADLCYSTALF
ncbi:MAG: DNA polymerase [Wendovervirus sonii]|uniref:DNA polymerase n=1 Tax=phage Lak_Megaphage_Sonny TaxID=3109229 RepID=A0ABZ0Z5S2_9CAUD|nr:MAG: DNA polymerase [phage Lak_Megaphage_Sonny]